MGPQNTKSHCFKTLMYETAFLRLMSNYEENLSGARNISTKAFPTV